MQFSPSATGYTVKEVARLKSPQKVLEFSGDASFDWENKNLKGIEADTLGKYFALVGQEFFALYKKTIKTWEKYALTQLAQGEKMVMKKRDDELKKLKKMGSGDDKVIEASKKAVSDEADKQARDANAAIEAKYRELLPDLAKKAHDAVVKKLGKAAGTLKKSHGKAIFKAVLFAVAVAGVVLAAVALGPLGGVVLGLGIAAVVIKGLTVLLSGIRDLRSYIKEFNKVSQKAAAEIDAAQLAIDKAVKAMEACNSVRQSLQLKIAGAQKELNKAQSGIAGNDKKIAKIQKDLASSRDELTKLERAIGAQTGDLLTNLKAAQSNVGTAKKKKPTQILDNLEKVMDVVDKVAQAAA